MTRSPTNCLADSAWCVSRVRTADACQTILARFQMGEAMAKRANSRKLRATSRVPSTPEMLGRTDQKSATLLLHGGDDAHEIANDVIRRIMKAASKSDISAADKVLFLLSCGLSTKALAGYSTLHGPHINEVKHVIEKIKHYIGDASQKRPLNFLMLASPGSGKSHFIRCVAESLKHEGVVALTYDLTALEKNDDLIPILEKARNEKVADKNPLIFLDEFDSRGANFPMLLPLLWSGEINIGAHELKLGKIIIVLAGSHPKLPDAMMTAKTLDPDLRPEDFEIPKVIDLLSRINGGTISIPPFHDRSQEIDRRADKICAAIHLLTQRFGSELRYAPYGLLRFIYDTDFRYGVRSIHQLIDLLPFDEVRENALKYPVSVLMADAEQVISSSIVYHLIEQHKNPNTIVDSWKKAHAINVQMPLYSEESDGVPDLLSETPGIAREVISHMYRELRDSD